MMATTEPVRANELRAGDDGFGTSSRPPQNTASVRRNMFYKNDDGKGSFCADLNISIVSFTTFLKTVHLCDKMDEHKWLEIEHDTGETSRADHGADMPSIYD
ncbi:hypothetical protein AAG570_005340 [Ranatra chinensis]|uniref:Uncharacterized protein n=1 Tax=Ranatra chinensis TaxID=642074 RepID=A0ABD0Y074_9HEMI